MIILLIFALLLIYPSPGSAFCPPSSFNYTAGPGLTVFLNPSDLPLNIQINVTESFPIQPTDVYILWDTSYSSRSFSYHYWRPNSRRLLGIMNATLQQNPDVRFGLGFFTTKRLLDIGHGGDYVYRHVVDVTANISKVDLFFSGLSWATTPAVGPYTSSLEAFLQVMLTANNTGFRPGSRRVVLLATDVMFGQQGDVAARTLSPLVETEDNSTFAFPRPNNYNGVLENNCTLAGNVCYDTCSPTLFQPRTANPSIYCQCGMVPINTLVPGVISKVNTSQFTSGSCEDFPTQAGVASIAQALGFELIAFTPLDTLGTNISNAFRQLNLLIGSGSVITNLDLRARLPPLVSQTLGVIPVTWDVSTIDGYTIGECNLTACTFIFEFSYPPGGSQVNGTIVINGDYNITVDVQVCIQSESPSESPTASFTETPSESPSNTETPSASQSDSQSQSPTPSASQSDSQSYTPSASQSDSMSPTPSLSPSESPTPSGSASQSDSFTPSKSPTPSLSQSDSRSQSHSQSPSISQSDSHSQSHTSSRSQSKSDSYSQSLSISESLSPSSVPASVSISTTPETASPSSSPQSASDSLSVSFASQSLSLSSASHSASASVSVSPVPPITGTSSTPTLVALIVVSTMLALCFICLICFGPLRRRRRRRRPEDEPLLANQYKSQ